MKAITAQEYAKQVLKSNLVMGFTLEQIMDDMKAATQRHLKKELKWLDKMEEQVSTTAGRNIFMNFVNKN